MKTGAFILIPTIFNTFTQHYLLINPVGEIKVATYEEDTEIDGVVYSVLTEEQVLELYKTKGIDYFLNTEQTIGWDSDEILECYKKDLLTAIHKTEVNSEW